PQTGSFPSLFYRVSVTPTSSAPLILRVVNGAATPVSIAFKVSETTMFSAAWGTNGTYDTFYSFFNTTNATCNGTITLTKTNGTSAGTTTVAVATGATASTNTTSGALATPRNFTGTATFTHDCPPGGILAEATIANFNITPTPYIQPVKFAAVREGN